MAPCNSTVVSDIFSAIDSNGRQIPYEYRLPIWDEEAIEAAETVADPFADFLGPTEKFVPKMVDEKPTVAERQLTVWLHGLGKMADEAVIRPLAVHVMRCVYHKWMRSVYSNEAAALRQMADVRRVDGTAQINFKSALAAECFKQFFNNDYQRMNRLVRGIEAHNSL